MPVADLSRQEAMARAQDDADHGWTVFFKFTCAHCGTRCVFQVPNVLPERGECHKCNKETELTMVGYMVVGLVERR